jgi:2,3-bisphosphoglycerate-independent phosphoglycerate mutase
MPKRTPVALIILDGFGYSEIAESNAIANANKPVWDRLWQQYPNALIETSGMAVGLPEGQMGNSEVGHMNLGAGRTVYQEFTRITKSIADGDFFENEALVNGIDKAVAAGKAVHLMGLLSPGGVHSHEDHIMAACKLAAQRGAKKVYVHGFLDGRDMPPRSAEDSIVKTDALLKELGVGFVASLIGRYYAMDRDNRWDRVELAYDLLTQAKAAHTYTSAQEALMAAYARDENDEFVAASSIQPEGEAIKIEDGDALLFMNFRADRAREITRCFVNANFDGFNRKVTPQLADFIMLTEYAADITATTAYPPAKLVNTLGEYMAKQGKTQLRIAETEKYAHVTFFFSGGRENEYDGETRVLIQSPQVATYDLQPEMSAPEVTDKLVDAIKSGDYDLIVCNYANGDMVGHTGKYDAAIKAIEALDVCLGRVTEALLEVGGECLITADHGNAEQMVSPTSGQAQTAHTTFPVPLIYVNQRSESITLDNGRLCDIAPSLLNIMGLKQPTEMSGQNLIQREKITNSH